jgi:type IV pilus assembly protein PilP
MRDPAKKPPITLAVALSVGLSGCVSSDRSDLEEYVTQTLASKGAAMEVLPAIKPAERYLYQAGENPDARDPFVAFEDKKAEAPNQPQTDDVKQLELISEMQLHEQNPEELEGFELDSLHMVGTLALGEGVKGAEEGLNALILDPEGTIYRVKVGHYVGKNYGKVIRVNEDGIELREIIKDAQGRWEERESKIAIQEVGK